MIGYTPKGMEIAREALVRILFYMIILNFSILKLIFDIDSVPYVTGKNDYKGMVSHSKIRG